MAQENKCASAPTRREEITAEWGRDDADDEKGSRLMGVELNVD